jgi:hypothetical protein
MVSIPPQRSESVYAVAPSGLTPGEGPPEAALGQYAGRHDRHASDSRTLECRRVKARRAGAASVRSRRGSGDGMGGLKAVSRITGLARSTINRGLPALDPEAPLQDLDATPVSGFSEQPRLRPLVFRVTAGSPFATAPHRSAWQRLPRLPTRQNRTPRRRRGDRRWSR